MRPARTLRRSRLVRLALVVALGTLLTACGGGGPQTALDPQGPFARDPDNLWQLVFWIAVAVFVLVQGLIVYTLVRFRDTGDDSLPEQVHGNTKLEIFWTVVPALILAGIAVPTVQTIFDLDREPPQAMQVEVIGHRWWWEFRYPGEAIGADEDIVTANELVIPVDRPVRLNMTAKDPADQDTLAVIHSFWVPALAGKQDVIPGRTTTLNIQADEPGRYLGQCAEYCGLSHANMRHRVVAMEQGDFDQWVSEQLQPAAEPEPGSMAAQGRNLIVEGGAAGGQACAACHAINGVDGANGRVGPNLTHLMSRKEFAGAVLDLYERENGEFTDEPNADLLRQWIDDPASLKPMQPEFGVGMPNLELTDEELDALVAYLITLK